jgi:hypothetical protein
MIFENIRIGRDGRKNKEERRRQGNMQGGYVVTKKEKKCWYCTVRKSNTVLVLLHIGYRLRVSTMLAWCHHGAQGVG